MQQPLSYVDTSANIARNVVIEPFVTIEKNVTIGSGTWIGSNVTIMEGTTIGRNCRIFPGAVISAIPQDLKFGGEKSEVIIGDNTTIFKSKISNSIIMRNCRIEAKVSIVDSIIASNSEILFVSSEKTPKKFLLGEGTKISL